MHLTRNIYCSTPHHTTIYASEKKYLLIITTQDESKETQIHWVHEVNTSFILFSLLKPPETESSLYLSLQRTRSLSQLKSPWFN